MAHCFVTGGTGFIGGHLVEALRERGDTVTCLVRCSSQTTFLESLGANLVAGEITDAAAIERGVANADFVFHLAGRTQATDIRTLMRSNVQGTETVARACAARSSPPTLVIVSSVAAAGPTRPGRIRLPNDRPIPISEYGRSKRFAEQVAARFAEKVPMTIVRPGVVFGPRCRAMLPAYRGIFRAHVHVVPFFNPPPLSIIDVRDLTTILLQAAERGSRIGQNSHDSGWSGYYFAADRESPNWRELGQMIAREGNIRTMFVFHLPAPLPWFVAAASESCSRIGDLSTEVTIDKIREASAPSWVCCTRTMRQELDFETPACLSQRIRESIDWYREAGWL